jgi:prephenate dehydratase
MTGQLVGYQGVKGSYSSMAVDFLFPNTHTKSYDQFETVLDDLTGDKIEVAVLPSDNTLIGSIFEVYDLLNLHDELIIVGEVMVKLDHKLMYIPQDISSELRLNQIKTVYSHPKALAQCREFIKTNPEMIAKEFADTAGAAQMVYESNDPTIAAIASQAAATVYGLDVYPGPIQDHAQNYTRFLALCHQSRASQIQAQINHISSDYKSSIVFVAAHQPGSLLACMQPFAEAGLNLTKIESRPHIGQAWEYLFFLDFVHSKLNGELDQILDQVRPHTKMLRNLGTYFVGETI